MKPKMEIVLCASGAVALAFVAGYAIGQAKAPVSARGVSAVELQSMDLDGEIEGLAGRKLRVRRVTFEPGAATQLHSHAGSPEVTYVLSGTYIVHQEGVPDAVRNPSDVGASGNNTRIGHWAENVGTVPAVFVAVDIIKK